MVEPEASDGNIIRRMHIACCITTATDTHSEYVIFIAFPLQQWARARCQCNIYACVYIACLANFLTKGIYRRNVGDVSSYCHRHHHHYYRHRRHHHQHWWNLYHNSKI